MVSLRSAASARWLRDDPHSRLGRRVREGLRAARTSGSPVLISLTEPLGEQLDPSAAVAASRRAGEPWFCYEQPDRDGFALAALGCLRALEAEGEGRFSEIEAAWRELVRDVRLGDDPGPPGSGLVALGGFAFAPEGGASPAWRGFAAGSLIVPELSLVRSAGRTWLTVGASVAPDDTESDVTGRLLERLSELEAGVLPLVDPDPAGRYEVASTMPPAHYEEAVRRAVQRIRAGELEKVVLAREVEVHAPVAHDGPAVLGLLREAFPSCFIYAVGRGDATFIGASPELLIRSEGQRASTVALAGTTRRSADPAVDDHLGEQLLTSQKDLEENEIVARRIARALRPHSVWVTAAPEPIVVRVANLQHLARPIRAQLASPLGVVKLAGLLHPTPAVGAEPLVPGLAMIPALEGFDRGWYAGPVGWVDATGDGEFCVALRCALLRGRVAHCYVGCGIVRDSDPAGELAESEIKLQAMLPALAG